MKRYALGYQLNIERPYTGMNVYEYFIIDETAIQFVAQTGKSLRLKGGRGTEIKDSISSTTGENWNILELSS